MHKKPLLAFVYAASLLALSVLAPGCQPIEKPEESEGQEQIEPTTDPESTTDPNAPFEPATEAVLDMGAGWNLGNTLDSNSNSLDNMWIEAWTARTPKDYETAWGQPQATRELIHMFKEAGFGGIRVPVTWYPHMGTITLYDQTKWDPSTWTGMQVDPAWMARVKEVVDYVIDEGMYCILNVHHDTGAESAAWLVASEEGFDAAKDRFEVLWKQIADEFKDYGERLLFESYNEMLDPYDSWCFASFATNNRYDAAVARSAYNAINSYAKLFVKTVRASGGRNSERNLIINTYGGCSGDGTWNDHLKEPLIELQLPEEPGHLIVEVHSYWESEKFYEQKNDIDLLFTNLQTHIIERLGVPALIGEWGGGSNEDNYNNTLFAGYFSEKARAAGIPHYYWMGLSSGDDRATLTWSMPYTRDAILRPYKQ